MIKLRGKLGRPPAKQDEIIADIRARIVRGEVPPAGRLPTRRELGSQYGASLPTVQQALDVLANDGFVLAKGTLGTFVVDSPPHLFRYALVFPRYPSDRVEPWPRFWAALVNEAMVVERSSPRKVPVFYGLDGRTNTEEYHSLMREVRSHTLGGLIFATQPSAFAGSPLLETNGVPRVAIMRPGWESLGVAAVNLDDSSFVAKALDYLASRGRKRIALIATAGDQTRRAQFGPEMAARGLSGQPWWTQFVPIAPPECASQMAMLLAHPGQSERPDGVVIADDNLVESVTSGLMRVGIRVPDDMEIVGHCNFPWPTPSVVPVRRLGYDSMQTLGACIESIDAQRRGETPPAVRIPALFEDEVKTSRPQSRTGVQQREAGIASSD